MPTDPGAALNALGLCGDSLEVSPEEQDFLADMVASLDARWQPADAAERALIRTIALVALKLIRLDGIELQVLGAAIAEPDGRRLPSLDNLAPYRERLLKERSEAAHRLRLAVAQRDRNEGEAGPDVAATAAAEPAGSGTVVPFDRERRRRLAAAGHEVA